MRAPPTLPPPPSSSLQGAMVDQVHPTPVPVSISNQPTSHSDGHHAHLDSYNYHSQPYHPQTPADHHTTAAAADDDADDYHDDILPARALQTHDGGADDDHDTHMTTHYANPYWPQYNPSASPSADSGDAGDDHEMEGMLHSGAALQDALHEYQQMPSLASFGASHPSPSHHHSPPPTITNLFSMAHATEAMDLQLGSDHDDFDDSISLGDDENMDAASAAHHMAHTQQYTLPPILPSQPIAELHPGFVGGPLPPVNPPHLLWPPQLPPGVAQALFIGDEMTDEEFAELHPMPISNQNPLSLAPENLNFVDFLRIWAENGRGKLPDIRRLRAQIGDVGAGTTRVEYNQLHGNKCDLQGIDWEDLGVPRRVARERRMMTYRNYTNKTGSEEWHVSSMVEAAPDGWI